MEEQKVMLVTVDGGEWHRLDQLIEGTDHILNGEALAIQQTAMVFSSMLPDLHLECNAIALLGGQAREVREQVRAVDPEPRLYPRSASCIDLQIG